MHTDRYLNFSSHHPLTHKKSAITSLFSHTTCLMSSPLDLAKERKHIACALTNNGYLTRSIQHTHSPLHGWIQMRPWPTNRNHERPLQFRPFRAHQVTATTTGRESWSEAKQDPTPTSGMPKGPGPRWKNELGLYTASLAAQPLRYMSGSLVDLWHAESKSTSML